MIFSNTIYQNISLSDLSRQMMKSPDEVTDLLQLPKFNFGSLWRFH